MSVIENDVRMFNVYTPLRNHLRKMKLVDSLQAIHYHILLQQFNKPLPNFVSAPIGYRNARGMREFIPFHILPWEIETLAKEVIINSPKYGTSKSLSDWHQLSQVINKLKALEENASKLYTTQKMCLLNCTELLTVNLPGSTSQQWEISPNTGKYIVTKIYQD